MAHSVHKKSNNNGTLGSDENNNHENSTRHMNDENNETWKDRAKRRMTELDMTQEDLAKPLGVKTRSAVGHYLSGRRPMTVGQLQSLLKALRMSYNALIFGVDDEAANNRASYQLDAAPASLVEIPFYKSVNAGLENAHGACPISRDRLAQLGMTAKNAIATTVSGESMSSTLKDGDIVVIDKSQQKPISSKVFAFDLDGDLNIRRFIRRIDGMWRLICDNEDKILYPDETVSEAELDQLIIIGKVVSIIQRDL